MGSRTQVILEKNAQACSHTPCTHSIVSIGGTTLHIQGVESGKVCCQIMVKRISDYFIVAFKQAFYVFITTSNTKSL